MAIIFEMIGQALRDDEIMGKSIFWNMPRFLLHLHCELLRDSNIKSTLT